MYVHNKWTNQVSVSPCLASVIKSSRLLLPRLHLYSGIKAVQKIETSIDCNPIGFRGRIIYVPGIGLHVLPLVKLHLFLTICLDPSSLLSFVSPLSV